MHFSTFLVAAIALCATSAFGKCLKSGRNWGDHEVAKEELAKACNELKGIYAPGQIAKRCRNNVDKTTSFMFEIENKTDRDANISQGECERNIGDQIDRCGHGGEVTYSGMRFRYVFYNWLWYTRLLLLTQIGAIQIKGGAKLTHRCGWSIRITCETRRKCRKGLKGDELWPTLGGSAFSYIYDPGFLHLLPPRNLPLLSLLRSSSFLHYFLPFLEGSSATKAEGCSTTLILALYSHMSA